MEIVSVFSRLATSESEKLMQDTLPYPLSQLACRMGFLLAEPCFDPRCAKENKRFHGRCVFCSYRKCPLDISRRCRESTFIGIHAEQAILMSGRIDIRDLSCGLWDVWKVL